MNLDNIELKNFTDLNDEEKLIVLKWRNTHNIRKWMYCCEIISKENHFKFIESLKENKGEEYFLVLKKKIEIGVIYFTDRDLNNSAQFGLYANPEIKGVGNVLMQTICNYAFKQLRINKLIAEVFIDNEKAINLYLRNNFKQYKRKKVIEKEIICMELIK